MKVGALLSRRWVEVGVTLLLLLCVAAFAFFVLENQASYGEDRVGLVELKESWGAVAGGYGIKGGPRANSYDFVTAYRLFRARPSVKRLLVSDVEFARDAERVDEALYRLESAEALGGSGGDDPGPFASAAAVQLDAALGDMSLRLAAYSRERLKTSRLSIVALVALIAMTASAFLVLGERARTASDEDRKSRALARALIAAQEAERLRISRELHDAVAQDLAAAKLYCGFAASPDAAKAVALLERSIGEIRDICYGLRPPELERLGVVEACNRLCTETSKASGLAVDFSAKGLEGLALGDDLGINIYRVLQEALTNVRRHARAREVRVNLSVRDGAARLFVEDDGDGPGSAPGGLGRRGMEERARMFGGSLEFGSAKGGASFVSALFPLG
jgi:signal transduction histidine kinase